MSPTPQCTKKKKKSARRCLFFFFLLLLPLFFFFSLLFHNQPASAQIRGIYSKLAWQRSPMPCKEKKDPSSRALSLERKTARGKRKEKNTKVQLAPPPPPPPPPPETFLPVTKFLPGRRTCPRVPEQRTCQLKRGKFCSR